MNQFLRCVLLCGFVFHPVTHAVEAPRLDDPIFRAARRMAIGHIYGLTVGAFGSPELRNIPDYYFYLGRININRGGAGDQARKTYSEGMHQFTQQMRSPDSYNSLAAPLGYTLERLAEAQGSEIWTDVPLRLHRDIERMEIDLARQFNAPLPAVHVAIEFLLRPDQLVLAAFDRTLAIIEVDLPLSEKFISEFINRLGQLLPGKAAQVAQTIFALQNSGPAPGSIEYLRINEWLRRRIGVQYNSIHRAEHLKQLGFGDETLRFFVLSAPVIRDDGGSNKLLYPAPTLLFYWYDAAIRDLEHSARAISKLEPSHLRSAILSAFNNLANELRTEVQNYPQRYLAFRTAHWALEDYYAELRSGRSRPSSLELNSEFAAEAALPDFDKDWRGLLARHAQTTMRSSSTECDQTLTVSSPIAPRVD